MYVRRLRLAGTTVERQHRGIVSSYESVMLVVRILLGQALQPRAEGLAAPGSEAVNAPKHRV